MQSCHTLSFPYESTVLISLIFTACTVTTFIPHFVRYMLFPRDAICVDRAGFAPVQSCFFSKGQQRGCHVESWMVEAVCHKSAPVALLRHIWPWNPFLSPRLPPQLQIVCNLLAFYYFGVMDRCYMLEALSKRNCPLLKATWLRKLCFLKTVVEEIKIAPHKTKFSCTGTTSMDWASRQIHSRKALGLLYRWKSITFYSQYNIIFKFFLK